jgi:hypothetical protein
VLVGDVDSIFDEPATDSGPAATGTVLASKVAEYLPLDRRRVHGDPPLTPSEEEVLRDLREWFDYEFGAGNPPLAGSQRRSLRVPADLKVSVSGAPTEVGKLCNLSYDGAFIETPDALAPETRLTVAIERAGGAAPVSVAACVQWAREIGNMDGPEGVGVAFVDLDDDDFLAIEQLVHHCLEAVARESS